MSTEVVSLRLMEAWSPPGKTRLTIEASPDTHFTVSHVPFEVVYLALYSPSPTPEEVQREYFLLESD